MGSLNPKIKHRLILSAMVILGVGVGFPIGCAKTRFEEPDTIAVAWGDRSDGQRDYYRAFVNATIADDGYLITVGVAIGSESNHWVGRYQDDQKLGWTKTILEAKQKWGQITWKPDGLHVGSYFLDRKTLETDR